MRRLDKIVEVQVRFDICIDNTGNTPNIGSRWSHGITRGKENISITGSCCITQTAA